MSATVMSKQQDKYPPNSDRKYLASISLKITSPMLEFGKDDLKQHVLQVEQDSIWGKSRNNWEWRFKWRGGSMPWREKKGWLKMAVLHPAEHWVFYTIETKCVIKHSQIHAFENFVVELFKEAAMKFPKMKIEVRPVFQLTVNTKCFFPDVAFVDPDGIPSAIVAVGADGDPLVLLVSEDTYNAFNATRDMLGVSHVELANKLRNSICRDGGQFHENSIMAALRRF